MADDQKSNQQDGVLADAARAVGTVAGKVARTVGLGESESAKPAKSKRQVRTTFETPAAEKTQPENLYAAESMGSGTFVITKPKRTRRKLHQSRTKSPQAGARK